MAIRLTNIHVGIKAMASTRQPEIVKKRQVTLTDVTPHAIWHQMCSFVPR